MVDLENIEFYKDNKIVEVSAEEIQQQKFIGLSNEDFILNYEWPESE